MASPPGTARRGLATPQRLGTFLGSFFLGSFSLPLCFCIVWGFRLGVCIALCDICWCKKGFIITFDCYETQNWYFHNLIRSPPVVNSIGHDLEKHTPVYVRSHSWQCTSEQRPSHEVEGNVRRGPRQDCVEAQIWGRVPKHFCSI